VTNERPADSAAAESIGRRAALLATVAAVFVFAVLARWQHPRLPAMLGTDEADYVRALSYGVAANYLGAREQSGVRFTADVIDEYRRTGWARPYSRDWAADDPAALRHYHPPLALYPVGALVQSGIRREQTLRMVPLVTAALACGASTLLAFALLGGTPAALRLAMSAGAGLITAASPYHAAAAVEIAPHAAFSLLSTLALVGLTQAVRGSARGWWILAWIFLGLATLTVYYWVLIVAAALWVWWWGLPDGRRSSGRLAIGIATAVAAAALAWPPLVVDGALVKPILMSAGILFKPPEGGSPAGTWLIGLLQSHRALIVVGVVGLFAWPVLGRERLRVLAPALIFIGAFLIVNLRVSYMKPLYASDLIAPLAAVTTSIAGLALARWLPAAAPVVATLAVLVGGVVVLPSAQAMGAPQDWKATLAGLNDEFAAQRVLVTPRPAAAVVKYYMDRAVVTLDSGHPADLADLQRGLSSGDIDIVFRWGNLVEPGGLATQVVNTRAADGTASVGGTLVSWWHVGAPRPQNGK
jgi:hypothetical protein